MTDRRRSYVRVSGLDKPIGERRRADSKETLHPARHRSSVGVLLAGDFSSLAISPDSSVGRASVRIGSFRAGVLGQTEQHGGGDEGAEDDAPRAHYEGYMVAGVEGGQSVGPGTGDIRRLSGRDGGERGEAQSAAHLLATLALLTHSASWLPATR